MLVQYDQLLHTIELANNHKVQTRKQTCQVTVTHNMEEGRRHGGQREGEATGKMVDRGTGGKGARGMAVG